jgi:hypothetical protein
MGELMSLFRERLSEQPDGFEQFAVFARQGARCSFQRRRLRTGIGNG